MIKSPQSGAKQRPKQAGQRLPLSVNMTPLRGNPLSASPSAKRHGRRHLVGLLALGSVPDPTFPPHKAGSGVLEWLTEYSCRGQLAFFADTV